MLSRKITISQFVNLKELINALLVTLSHNDNKNKKNHSNKTDIWTMNKM